MCLLTYEFILQIIHVTPQRSAPIAMSVKCDLDPIPTVDDNKYRKT